jgi:uncharacterized OB-fold protein
MVLIVLVFTRGMAKDKDKMEIKKKELEIMDKHFSEMTRVECPYCQTVYATDKGSCPTCGAETKKILFPKLTD